MHRVSALIAVVAAALVAPAAASAHPSQSRPTPEQTLTRALRSGLAAAGSHSGAYVVDLTTGQVLFSERSSSGRQPASVEKLYTTSTALIRYGPSATLQTRVLGVGSMTGAGTWHGTLYLRGGGDPTFGEQGFDRYYYGTGATVQQLVANLVRATGIKALDGQIVADESYFDALRGTPATGYQPSFEVEGQLSGLVFDRGFTDVSETAFQPHPALFAAQQFEAALRFAHVRVPNRTPLRTGVTPTGAQPLAGVASPPIATLLRLTNTPSDNFFAETLIKDLGESFGTRGSTAAGAAVVRAQIASSFGIHPILDDGSGLSYSDYSTPRQVVTLLTKMASDRPFVDSLAIAGETGTLSQEMNGTIAQGRCRGKTGTLVAVSNLVGYCTARDGHTLAFAFLMSAINPFYAHPIQDQMAVALAKYDASSSARSSVAATPQRGGRAA